MTTSILPVPLSPPDATSEQPERINSLATVAVEWTEIAYPEPEFDAVAPTIPASAYADRLKAVRRRMAERRLDLLVVYADRERFANLAWLTGYEPRFEEALLIVRPEEFTKPVLLVGNEGFAYAGIAKLHVQVVLCQTLSLPGQPRGSSPPLFELLVEHGLAQNTRIGVIGAKTFSEREAPSPERTFDVPSFVIDPLRGIAGLTTVTNETALFTDPTSGLRCGAKSLTVHDIALFERAAEISYAGVRRLLLGLKPGISEAEATALLGYAGYPPLSCHIALGFGAEHTGQGLGSPDPNTRLNVGDPIAFGFGVWGGNIARTGIAVSDESDLPPVSRDYLDRLAGPYFRCLKAWYEALRLGATAGDVYESVRWFVEDPAMGVTLNPGHLLHLDEWPESPFASGSSHLLSSGMSIQCDIIAAPGAPLYGIHTEDGVVLADYLLCRELAAAYPATWARIQRRQTMLRETLGIQIADEVLPLSSMAACVCPFLLAPQRILRAATPSGESTLGRDEASELGERLAA